MLKDAFTEDQIGAAEQLLVLINPDTGLAEQQIGQLRAMLRSGGDDDDDEAEDYEHILWLLGDVIDWESGYFVDWKEARSCVDVLTLLAARWGVSLSFGDVKGADVATLLARAHGELSTHGLTLWGWQTDSDCYCGWITRADAAAELTAISRTLGVAFRPASQPF